MGTHSAVTYAAYGISIDSEVELPLPGAVGAADDAATVNVRHGRVDDSGITLAPIDPVGDEEPWLEVGWGERTCVLIFPELAAQMRPGGDDITIDVVPGTSPELAAHVVLDHVVPRWLYLQGDLVLHGSAAMMPSGRVVTFVGATGQGKSSMGTALAALGWTPLSDDAVRVVSTTTGWRAHPSYPGVRLQPDSRASLAAGVPSVPMAADWDKHRLVPHPWSTSSARLGLVVQLGDERPEPRLRRLDFAAATTALTRHSFVVGEAPGRTAATAFLRSSGLAADVPCLELEFPRVWDVYPAVAELLLAVDAAT